MGVSMLGKCNEKVKDGFEFGWDNNKVAVMRQIDNFVLWERWMIWVQKTVDYKFYL